MRGSVSLSPRDVAVIDIGSNSVRLVHYQEEGGTFWPVFNEKVMAGLGRGVSQTGVLNPEGIEITLRALQRFQKILDARAVSDRRVVATAAVRQASDGTAFVSRIESETGLKTRILSGLEEGNLSAKGVMAGIPDASGLIGDLGGSSLELAPVVDGVPGLAQTCPLGPQMILVTGMFDPEKAEAIIESHLADCAFLKSSPGPFYAVGGAWRALAQLSFAHADYPLRIVQGYTLNRAEALQLTDLAARLSPESLAGIPGVSSRRAESLPWAAFLLRHLIKSGRCTGLVFSAYGLREGVVMEGLSDNGMKRDSVIAGVEALVRPVSAAPEFGPALAQWLSSFMEALLDEKGAIFSPSRDPMLIEAAARLVDLGVRMHPDHRVALVRNTILYAPIAGLSHEERVFLAACLHYRYGGGSSALQKRPAYHLLTEEQLLLARILGMAFRLAVDLSGYSPALLQTASLQIKPETIRLDINDDMRDLLTGQTEISLGKICKFLGRKLDVSSP